MRKTYISAGYLQSEVKKIILSEKNYAVGTSVHPSAYIFNYQDHLELEFLAYQNLINTDLKVLKEIIRFPKTTQTLLAFIKEMKLYGIEIEDLPNTSEVDSEIKQSITHLFPLIELPLTLDKNTSVIPTGLTHSIYHYTQNSHQDFTDTQNPKTIRYHYAQNKRQELEAVIQEIIQKDLKSVCLVVSNKKDTLSFIESIMKRYGVTVNLENRDILLAKQQFATFFDFLYNRNQRNFIESLKENVFQLNHPHNVLSYVEHYNLRFDRFIDNNLCTDERSPLFKLQNKIEHDLKSLNVILKETQTLSYHETYQYVYEHLVERYQSQMFPYKTYFETYHAFIQENNHLLIVDHILNFNPKITLPESWKIVDYNSLPLIPQKNIYLLGLSAQDFPNVSSKTGIIDETYLDLINNYPNLETRSNYDLGNKRRIYQLGENLVFSYHLANYEGKSVEPSFEIKDFCESHNIEATLWPLKQIRYREKHKPALNPMLAQKLFTRNNTIYGSVSSMQKYVYEPILYFMENGLKLREEEDISFNPMIFGNLNHEIAETGNVEEAWDKHVWSKHPKNSLFLKLIEDRNTHSMSLNQGFLQEAETKTKFKPNSFEEKVITDKTFDHVELLGYVDRIDIADDYFIIVDYKSSDTRMSEASFIRGQQLQLLSYAALIQEKTKRKPLGVFYYAFRNPNSLEDQLYNYTISKGVVPLEHEDPKDLWTNKKRYTGWLFEDPNNYFETSKYWNGLRDTANGVVSYYKKVYDFPEVEKLLQDRYNKLYEYISNGVLDIDDIEMELDEKPELKKEIR